MSNIQLFNGDCLEIMKNIPNKSIDMILCDLPYGTTQNNWDSIIPLDELWKQYERIIKDDGCIALFAQPPFDKVLDNCMGSGTTGVACKNLNRNFIGIELNEEYFKIAQERISE